MSGRPVTFARSAWLVLLGCAALAALSLVGPHQATYDPWAWLIWGREIAHGTLSTVGGPSWKPLPVMLTAPFSLAGDAAAPLLWLVVARTGLLLAVVLAYRVARATAGPVAGVVAAVGLLLVDDFAAFGAVGNAEGLLVALALGAVDRHLAGQRRLALALGAAAGLLRPEVWPLLAAYALWLLVRDREGARRTRLLVVLAALAAGLLALWFVPEQLGSGRLLRGAARARDPVAGSPGQAAHPFVEVFRNSAPVVPVPLYVGGVLAVALAAGAWRRHRRRAGREAALVLVLALAATVHMVVVAVLAQAGFTGNGRYVLLPASVVCVLGGVGLVALGRLLAERLRPPALAAAALPLVLVAVAALAIAPGRRTERQLAHVRQVSRLYDGLDTMIARAGGRRAILRCRPIYTGPFETQLLIWKLHARAADISIHPQPPGTTLTPYYSDVARDPRFPLRLKAGRWVLRSTCA